MTFGIRKDLLKAAYDDPETNKKLLDPNISLKEIQNILAEFAKKRGFKVVQI